MAPPSQGPHGPCSTPRSVFLPARVVLIPRWEDLRHNWRCGAYLEDMGPGVRLKMGVYPLCILHMDPYGIYPSGHFADRDTGILMIN